MIEELKALAEKATPGPVEVVGALDGHDRPTRVKLVSGVTVARFDQQFGRPHIAREQGEVEAQLYAILRNNLPAILSALEVVPVMKEALEKLAADQTGHYGYADWVQETARQALAALEGK